LLLFTIISAKTTIVTQFLHLKPVVVQGKTETLNNGNVTSTSFNFYDPGTRNQGKGTSSSNTLRNANGRLVGSHINKANTQIVVTSIRPTR